MPLRLSSSPPKEDKPSRIDNYIPSIIDINDQKEINMAKVFEHMAKKHWRKYLPEKTRQLEAEGMFDEATKEAGEQACRELANLVHRGMNLESAKEIVLPEYILLPPENTRVKRKL